MYLGDNLQAVYNALIKANAVQVKPDDLDAIFFENNLIASGANAISTWADVQTDKNKTLYVKTLKNFSVYVQFTNDETKTEWFDLCDSSGSILIFTCNNQSKAIPISIKGLYMRVLVKNNDTEADTPYVAVT